MREIEREMNKEGDKRNRRERRGKRVSGMVSNNNLLGIIKIGLIYTARMKTYI